MQTSNSKTGRALAYTDWIVGATLFFLTLLVYLRTLAPSVAYLFDDSLEFQLLASRMAIAHPTGYPLYSILIKLATFLPIGDVAYRVNLVSALSGAGAVFFAYLAGRLVTARFLNANNTLGHVLTRAPAMIAALILAFGETFWSQAVLAEVYAPQALLTAALFWLVLRWGARQGKGRLQDKSLIPIVFFAGLMLTHHRMSVLLYPALAGYVLSYDRRVLTRPLTLVKLAAVFALPLLFYLYLPLRGTVTSSLDGAYQNTPDGFMNWILGTAYTVFVTQNPFNQTRDAGYYLGLFLNDVSALGLLIAVGGFVALFLRAWREWILLALALVANLAFVLTYRVADINVFFIPVFVVVALFVAAGLAGLLWLAYYGLPGPWANAVAGTGTVILLLVPFALAREAYPRVDLSNKNDVIAYGREILEQPLPPNATIIGILGEMSLLRYLQDTQKLRPDVETIAADKEEDRLKAIDEALKRGREVLLTRALKGIENEASLTSVGPLIRVQSKANRQDAPNPEQKVDADFGDVKLLGFDAQLDAEPRRVTLYWQALKRISDGRLISLKLIDANGRLGGQADRRPVLDAYPTTAWRNGEYIADSYDLPVFVGAAPGDYGVQVTMYDPESGRVFGQQELGRVRISPHTETVARELLGVQTTVLQDLGGLELSGFDLDTSEPFPPAAGVPLTLLWRVGQDGATREFAVTVTDEFGKVVLSQSGTVGGDDVRAGQYVREELGLALPAHLADGKYVVRVTAPGGLALPFQPNSVTLDALTVKEP